MEQDQKKAELAKSIIEAYPEKFEAKPLVEDALEAVIYSSREEAIDKIKRLIQGKYYLTKEVDLLEKQLEKKKGELAKKEGQLAEVGKGNFDVLFKKED